MSSAGFDITHNVDITVFDANHCIKQVIHKHNKANKNLVLGIIKFLRGEFTPSNLNDFSTLSHNEKEAKQFVPAYISFGDGGLQQIGTTDSTTGQIVTDLTGVLANITTLPLSKFNTKQLTRELVGNSIGNSNISNKPAVGRCSISRTSYNTGSTDSITLKLSTIVTKGYYSKNFYLDYKDYRDQLDEYIYLSELGLWATDFNGDGTYRGNLLARVTFTDENTIIKQKDDDVILVDWKIEITSLDSNFEDYHITNVEWE